MLGSSWAEIVRNNVQIQRQELICCVIIYHKDWRTIITVRTVQDEDKGKHLTSYLEFSPPVMTHASWPSAFFLIVTSTSHIAEETSQLSLTLETWPIAIFHISSFKKKKKSESWFFLFPVVYKNLQVPWVCCWSTPWGFAWLWSGLSKEQSQRPGTTGRDGAGQCGPERNLSFADSSFTD